MTIKAKYRDWARDFPDAGGPEGTDHSATGPLAPGRYSMRCAPAAKGRSPERAPPLIICG